MSTLIRVTRICQYCGKAFEAKTTVTKFCSSTCNSRSYKAGKRSIKVEKSNEQTRQIVVKPMDDLRSQEYLTIAESAQLVRVSRRTLYRLNERGELPFVKLSRRTLIRRLDIDKLFERPAQLMELSRPLPVPLADCYTLAEVRQKYPISDKALYDLIKRNNIPKQYKGKFAYVPKASIDETLNNTSTSHD